jgi:hypothetical protein
VIVPAIEPLLDTLAASHTTSLVTGVVFVGESEVVLGANATGSSLLSDIGPSAALIEN